MAGGAIFAVDDAGETGAELVGTEVGEEAEFAEVDAENRPLVVAHLPGGAENGAVAAQDNGQICRHGAEVALLQEIDNGNGAVAFEKGNELVRFFPDPRFVGIAQYEDAAWHRSSPGAFGAERAFAGAAHGSADAVDIEAQ